MLRINNWKTKLLVFSIFIIYKLVLDFVCANVYPVYSGGLAASYEPSAHAISWLLYIFDIILMVLFVVPREDLVSTLFSFIFILNATGFYTLYGLKTNMTLQGFLAASAFWTVFILAIALLPRRKNILQLSGPSTAPGINPIENILFVATAIAAVILSGVYGDFRLFISFGDVYSYRAVFLEASIPGIVSYTIRWISGVFIPYFFVRFLTTKKYALSVVSLLLGLLMYGIDGLKTTFVLYLSIIYFFYSIKHISKKNASIHRIYTDFLLMLIGAILLNYGLFVWTGKYFFNTELYRVLIIPPIISDNYFNFIVNNQPLLLRESIMRFFFASPYDTSINYLVAPSAQVIANTGMFGDAYANFKIIGVVIYPFLYTMIIKLWQNAADNYIDLYSVSLGFIIIWNAMNVSFFTWILTGGVIIFFILSYIVKNNISLHGRGRKYDGAR